LGLGCVTLKRNTGKKGGEINPVGITWKRGHATAKRCMDANVVQEGGSEDCKEKNTTNGRNSFEKKEKGYCSWGGGEKRKLDFQDRKRKK